MQSALAAADLRWRLEEVGPYEASMTASSAAAAATAALAAAAAPEHVAYLRRNLAALEVEAAAEQLPPLNRKATAVLCRRLAAALASMRDDVSPHRIADHGQAQLLAMQRRILQDLHRRPPPALQPPYRCRRRRPPPACALRSQRQAPAAQRLRAGQG